MSNKTLSASPISQIKNIRKRRFHLYKNRAQSNQPILREYRTSIETT
jgi:hypothetical protein